MDVKEFFIPFPGGYIAAKSWGNETGIPVLALHGWQDNIGTFDRIAPQLSSKMYIVGFDYLGHGLSIHKPPGSFYYYIDMLTEIKRVVDFLKWDRFSIMGHSYGASLALLYGSFFPENVLSVTCLDMIKPFSTNTEDLPETVKSAIQGMLVLESKLNKPVRTFSLEGAKAHVMKRISEEIVPEAATILLQRGTKSSKDGGVVFTHDIRTKMLAGFIFFSDESLKLYLSNLVCPVLMVVGKNSKMYTTRNLQISNAYLQIYKDNCKLFKLVEVEGNHFAHLNNPEIVTPHVSKFFQKYGQQ